MADVQTAIETIKNKMLHVLYVSSSETILTTKFLTVQHGFHLSDVKFMYVLKYFQQLNIIPSTLVIDSNTEVNMMDDEFEEHTFKGIDYII
jgi:hypothetical protein